MAWIQVRLEGETEQEVRKAAQLMGVTLKKVYMKRDRRGYLGYGYRKIEEQSYVNVKPAPRWPCRRAS